MLGSSWLPQLTCVQALVSRVGYAIVLLPYPRKRRPMGGASYIGSVVYIATYIGDKAPDILEMKQHAWYATVDCTFILIPWSLYYSNSIDCISWMTDSCSFLYMYFGSKVVEGASQSSPSTKSIYAVSEGSPPRFTSPSIIVATNTAIWLIISRCDWTPTKFW